MNQSDAIEALAAERQRWIHESGKVVAIEVFTRAGTRYATYNMSLNTIAAGSWTLIERADIPVELAGRLRAADNQVEQILHADAVPGMPRCECGVYSFSSKGGQCFGCLGLQSDAEHEPEPPIVSA